MHPPTPEPLARRRLFQTGDLDEARAIVAGKFCDHRLDIASTAARFDACHHRAEGRSASLNYIRYGADVMIEPGELGSFYLIQIPLSGQAEIANGAGAVQTGPGVGSVLNPHRHTRMRWHAGCAHLLLQVDAEALQRTAESLTGRTLPTPVTFATAVDARRSSTAAWIQKLRACFALADRQAVFADSRVHTQVLVEEELIAAFLDSQPSTISHRLDTAPSAAANRHVRRAVQFIQDRLQDPIALADIAAAAGVTPRSLQLGFRAAFGQTPMQYLRDRRLHLARHLLATEGATTSIADICHRVGISHIGRFSGQYRATFGETPSETRRTADLS